MRPSGTAVQSSVTSGRSHRGLLWWIALAMSSLPVPLSPMMQTLASPVATLSILARTSRSCCDWPIMPTYRSDRGGWGPNGALLIGPFLPATPSSQPLPWAMSFAPNGVLALSADLPGPRRPSQPTRFLACAGSSVLSRVLAKSQKSCPAVVPFECLLHVAALPSDSPPLGKQILRLVFTWIDLMSWTLGFHLRK